MKGRGGALDGAESCCESDCGAVSAPPDRRCSPGCVEVSLGGQSGFSLSKPGVQAVQLLQLFNTL